MLASSWVAGPTGPTDAGPGGRRAELLDPWLFVPVLAVVVVGLAAWLLGPFVGAAGVLLPVAVVLVLNSRRDVTTIMVVLALVLLLWPSTLRIAALGAAGTPAVLGGIAALLAWGHVRIRYARTYGMVVQPVRWALYLVAASSVASYLAAYLRRPDGIELRSADRGLVIMIAGVGLALLAADGIRGIERLRSLIRWIVIGATGVGVIGVLEFVTGFALAKTFAAPGFSRMTSDWDNERSGFSRIFATAEHPIELSVILAMTLPLAFYCAITAEPGRARRWWLCAALIGLGLPMTVSRTAALGGIVALLVSSLSWSGPQRVRALIWSVPAMLAMKVAFPGLLGTIRALFTSAGQDPSVSARSADYATVTAFVNERPLFGRGYATLLPSRYLFLDNQYLLTVVETGLVGLLAVVALLLVGCAVARGARRRLRDSADGALAVALLASTVVATVTSALYDSWSFSTGRGLTFLLIGCAGALWRLTRFPEHQPSGSAR